MCNGSSGSESKSRLLWQKYHQNIGEETVEEMKSEGKAGTRPTGLVGPGERILNREIAGQS